MIQGLVHVSGAYNTGKTTFGLTAGNPQRAVVLDFEKSAEGFVATLPVGAYHNVVGEFMAVNNGELNLPRFYEFIQRLVAGLPKGAFDVALVDNASLLEAAIVAAVEQNPAHFGLTSRQVEKSSRLVYGPARDEFRRLIDILHHNCAIPLVIVTTHLQERYLPSGQPAGIFYPRCLNTFAPISVLTIWLRPRVGTRVPSALVIKDRLGRPYYVMSLDQKKKTAQVAMAGGPQELGPAWYGAIARSMAANGIETLPAVVPVQCLPRKIPVCTWANIEKYLTSPADWDNPAEGEVPSEEELAILNGTMTKEQRDILRLSVLTAEQEARQNQQEPVPSVDACPTTIGELVARAVKQLGLRVDQLAAILGVGSIVEVEDYAAAWEKLRAAARKEE